MNRLKLKAFVSALFCLSLAPCLFSQGVNADLVSVDATVFLRPDGKAEISQRLEWAANGGGEMHGFYFQGEPFEPVWNRDRCWADLPDGKRYALSIRDSGGRRYDVVIAQGRGFSGKAFYNLAYAGDFASQGLIGKTRSADGKDLVYFDWGPPAWDEGLESRTLRIVFPRKVGAEKLSDEEKAAIPLLSEKGVNAENKIDWYGTKADDGSFLLTGLFYETDIAARAEQRIRLYFPAGYLDFSGAELSEPGADETESESPQFSEPAPPPDYLERNLRARPAVAAALIAVLIALGLLLYSRRLSLFRRRKALLAGLAWAGDSWSPPKLLVGSYEVPGKVAEGLHPIEVALLMLLKAASREYGWALDLASIALVWRAGCIIRSPFLDDIAAAYRRDPSLSALFLDAHFKSLLDQSMPALRKVTARSIEAGVPVPAFSSALSLYDGYRSTWLPANLIQALRDRFGEHGYERIDRPRGERFHSEWR